MAKYVTPNSSYNNFIYHITCNGKLYIGQSIRGLNRIRQHCNNAYRDQGFDDSGAEKVYEEIRKHGLYNTKIEIFDESINYGLDESDFATFYSIFEPKNREKENDRINAAEIIHILKALYQNNEELTNISMGGQGSSYTSPLNKDLVILTRAMGPKDAMQILNMSQRSREDILKTNRLINQYIFTDDWKRVVSTINRNILTNDELFYIDMSWNQFVDFLEQNLIETLDYSDKKWTSSAVTQAITNFVTGRQKVLKDIVQTTGMLFSDQLTEAQRNLFLHMDTKKLITAKFTDSADDVIDYIRDAISFAVSSTIKKLYSGIEHDMRRMSEEEKKVEKALRSKLWSHAKKHHDFSIKKLQSFKIVNITKWFDFDSVHLRGNTAWLSNPLKSGDNIQDILKGYSLLTFAWYYNEVTKGINNYLPQYVLTPQNIFGSTLSFGGAPNAIYSKRQIDKEDWLTNRMHEKMSHLKFLSNYWDKYFADMIAVYRQEYGKPLTMGMTEVRFDQEEPLFYSTSGEVYIVYNSNLYTLKSLNDLKIY